MVREDIVKVIAAVVFVATVFVTVVSVVHLFTH